MGDGKGRSEAATPGLKAVKLLLEIASFGAAGGDSRANEHGAEMNGRPRMVPLRSAGRIVHRGC